MSPTGVWSTTVVHLFLYLGCGTKHEHPFRALITVSTHTPTLQSCELSFSLEFHPLSAFFPLLHHFLNKLLFFVDQMLMFVPF